MKCLDKKRIKLKHGETLALNERHMLQMVSVLLLAHFIFFFVVAYSSSYPEEVIKAL